MLIISISPFTLLKFAPSFSFGYPILSIKMPPFISFSSTFHYLCPHDEKVCRRHIAFAFVQLLTYSLPDEWVDEAQTGCRVVVPFGRKKYYTAIVRNVHYCAPPNTK